MCQKLFDSIKSETAHLDSLKQWTTDKDVMEGFGGFEINFTFSELVSLPDIPDEFSQLTPIPRASQATQQAPPVQEQDMDAASQCSESSLRMRSCVPDTQLQELPVDVKNDIEDYISLKKFDNPNPHKLPKVTRRLMLLDVISIINEAGCFHLKGGIRHKLYRAKYVYRAPVVGQVLYKSRIIDPDDELTFGRVFSEAVPFCDVWSMFNDVFAPWDLLTEIGIPKGYISSQDISNSQFGSSKGAYSPEGEGFPIVDIFSNMTTRYMHPFRDGAVWTKRDVDNKPFSFDENTGVPIPDWEFLTWEQLDTLFGRENIRFMDSIFFDLEYSEVSDRCSDDTLTKPPFWPLCKIVYTQLLQSKIQQRERER